MPEFKNEAEYEKWKAEKIKSNEEKKPQKGKLFICPYCKKEFRSTILNPMKCPYCQTKLPVPRLIINDNIRFLLGIVSIIIFILALGYTCSFLFKDEQTAYQEQKERELRKTLDTIGMDKEKTDDIIDTMKRNAGKK